MAQYIDKATVVAEIERRKRDWGYRSSIEAKFKREECDDILSFLDTLEVKEIDLEKYYRDFLKREWFEYNGARTVSGMMFLTAQHFFELGLKAQKEE